MDEILLCVCVRSNFAHNMHFSRLQLANWLSICLSLSHSHTLERDSERVRETKFEATHEFWLLIPIGIGLASIGIIGNLVEIVGNLRKSWLRF